MNFFEKRRWAKLLKGCDYYGVAEKTGMAFDGSIISQELSILLDAYCSYPCLETAIGLIKFDLHENRNPEEAKFITLFMLASDVGSEEFYHYFRNNILPIEKAK